MSASPSGMSNGQTPTPKASAPGGFIKRRTYDDPLRPKKKPVRRPAGQPPRPPHTGQLNGQHSLRPTPQNASNGFMYNPQQPPRPTGWTKEATGHVEYYPLLTTKRALKEGIRYHVARFASKKAVDPSNQDEFTRPVLLHRRDPRQPPPGKPVKEEEVIEEPIDSKEREKQEAVKAEKDRQKAEDLAQIAPSGNNASAMAQKKNQPFRNEKTTQVHRLDKTAEEKKASDLRYEEALPWHLEDADNKSTWVGNYEAALSHVNVMFFVDGGAFKMVPLEKWYKFAAKPQFKVFTIEEAEAQMGKKVKESRWVMKTDEEKQALRDSAESKKMTSMFTVKGETNTFKSSSKRETEDMDQLDFAEDDLFQDDDEQPGFDPADDEDTKDIKVKIKREQLGANLFGDADEHEVDALFEEEEKEKELTKKEGKGTRKALKKRERNLNYDSDSDHPYSSSVGTSLVEIATTNT